MAIVLNQFNLIEQNNLEPQPLIDQLLATSSDPATACTTKLAVLGLQGSLRAIKHIDDVARN
jgi:hypothetical protein